MDELEIAFKAGFEKEASKCFKKQAEMSWGETLAGIGGTLGFFEPTPFGEIVGAGTGFTVGSMMDVGSMAADWMFGGDEQKSNRRAQRQGQFGQNFKQNYRQQMQNFDVNDSILKD